MKTLILFIICLLLVSLMMQSCSTKPEQGTLKGTVILFNDSGDPMNDPVDHAGVTVALYELAVLDTSLVRINGEYPQIGVLISQETDFDHRNSDPIKSTTSNANGSFSINGIDPGKYNLVLFKENWGVRYIHNVEVSENSEFDLGSMEMYPVLSYSSSVTDEITFRSDHCYQIPDHVNFIGDVNLEPRAKIFVDPGVMVKFYGNVGTPSGINISEAWRFLPSKDIYTIAQYEIVSDDYYNSVVFYGNSIELRNGIFRHIVNAVVMNTSNCEIDNIMVREFGSGISIPQGNASIHNLIVSDGIDYGINVSSTSTDLSEVSDCIMKNTSEGVVFTTLGTYTINNCYFINNNWMSIRVSNSIGSISHNCFDNNNRDIYLYGGGFPTYIGYNNFYLSRLSGIVPSRRDNIINNNNFYRTSGNYIIIWVGSLGSHSFVEADLDATYNYWGVANIDDFLLDANDNDDHPDTPCPYYIIYQPKRNSPVLEAGIQ